MKKIFYVFVICISFIAGKAQPALLSSEMLPFGSVMTEKYVMYLSVIDTTIQGAGVVWNFSSIINNPSKSDLILNIVNPSSTPYAANFPGTNYVYRETEGSATNYRYFILGSTKMERVGSYVSNINTYNDPQIEYVFPLTLGTKNNDTWDNTNSSFGGTYDIECIGTGTLNLPGGSYNALMVRMHMVESFLDFYTYFWYSSDNGAILIEYVVGDGFYIEPFAFYLSSLSNSINENELITDIWYNNPVENNFTLHVQAANNGTCTYTVLNTLGKKLLSGNTELIAGNVQTLNINFSSFPAGIYFFSIYPEESPFAGKTIKIIKQ